MRTRPLLIAIVALVVLLAVIRVALVEAPRTEDPYNVRAL